VETSDSVLATLGNKQELPMKIKILLLVGFVFLCLSPAPNSSLSKTVEEVLTEFNKLGSSERQKKLEEGARKEGFLKFSSNESMDSIQVLHNAFAARYPFIKLESSREPGLRGVTRIILEHRAGRLDTDVVGLPFEGVVQTEKAGVLVRYNSPERRYYSAGVKDKDGYWTAPHYSVLAIGYNTKTVKAEEAPRGYVDLLQPRFKGELSIDSDPHRAIMAWLIAWGEEKTREYTRALLQNGMMPRKGHTLQTQLLCAGEFKIGVELHAYQIMQARREKGCPIGMVFTDPTPASTGSHIGITKAAPHPYAAALFIDFMLGVEGAKIVADSGRLPTRKGTQARYEEVSNLEEKGFKLVITLPDEAYRLEPTAEKLIKEITMSR
jgi:iron(III) transport system substrate-binding protein